MVPVKALENAKTRLRADGPDDRSHADLVRSIQLDTLEAIVAASTRPSSSLARVWLVGVPGELPDVAPGRLTVVDDPGGGLNNAISHAADLVANDPATRPDDRIAVIVGDLPSLTPHDLLLVLTRAEAADRCFVPDRAGTGTTLLTARVGVSLDPSFGPGSAARHRESGALALAAPASVRADADTGEDLAHCLQLGVGRHTAAFLGADRRTADESFI